MKVYIVGEDAVSYVVIKKVLLYCSREIEIIAELPARGGQIKQKISEFNKLSESYPVILLSDLDNNDCAPQLLNKLFPKGKNEHFIFNIAIDEAEAWLMADRDGFSKYFYVDIADIPFPIAQKQGGPKALIEMDFKYKSSMFLTHELIRKSKKKELLQQLMPKVGAVKGPEYNSVILPFIENYWDISQARKNADSLNRMICRIERLFN